LTSALCYWIILRDTVIDCRQFVFFHDLNIQSTNVIFLEFNVELIFIFFRMYHMMKVFAAV
jgi:hypothetical protein